ncbi:hypothetical protein EDB19DRAFT_1915017 [Suillus lakei]|nr:hypothetical protein EDB19DRAFT_1915017 [Suillus lakei]
MKMRAKKTRARTNGHQPGRTAPTPTFLPTYITPQARPHLSPAGVLRPLGSLVTHDTFSAPLIISIDIGISRGAEWNSFDGVSVPYAA